LSYTTEEEDITRKYDHDHMIIAISKNTSESRNNVGQKLLHLYVPQEYAVTVEKAKKIARREGRSISKLVMELLRDYVRVHEPGNPQLPLTRFTEEEKPQEPPRWLTCMYSRKELRRGEFYCERFSFWRIPQACTHCPRYRPEE